MPYCEFCNIIARQEPDVILAQDDQFIAVKDIKPDFEFHYQVIPKRHIESIDFLSKDDLTMLEKMGTFAANFMAPTIRPTLKDKIRYGFHKSEATSVDHLHLHCIAGKQTWIFATGHFITLDDVILQLKNSNGNSERPATEPVTAKL